jgi:tetratricopeptide (TPR) repeat protein
MPGEIPPLLGATLTFLRLFSGWEQKELAAFHGMDGSRLSRLEKSHKLTRELLEMLVEPLVLPPGPIDRVLDCVREIDFGRTAPRSPEEAERWHLERAAARLGREAHEAGRAELGRYLADRALAQEREAAHHAWAHLQARPKKDWPALIAGAREYQGWALCELVCAESERAAANRADRALELARLAVRIAAATPGDLVRALLLGYALAHLANATRVAGDLPRADRAFAAAKAHWKKGHKANLPLDRSRMLDLEASLRRAQRKFSEALVLLDRASKISASNESFCRILLKKAFTLEQSGDYQAAVATLQEAAPLVEDQGDPRQLFGLRYNLIVNLVHAGQTADAGALLSEVWELAGSLGNELDLWRAHWLEARVATEQGRTEAAVSRLEQVQAAFARSGNLYDTALSTLELTALYLRQNRRTEVRNLAVQTARALTLQGVAREALGALLLFFEAAEQEAVTVDLVKDLLRKCDSQRPQAVG